jgi:hypothetical protein
MDEISRAYGTHVEDVWEYKIVVGRPVGQKTTWNILGVHARKLLKMYLKELGWGERVWDHLAKNRNQR